MLWGFNVTNVKFQAHSRCSVDSGYTNDYDMPFSLSPEEMLAENDRLNQELLQVSQIYVWHQ